MAKKRSKTRKTTTKRKSPMPAVLAVVAALIAGGAFAYIKLRGGGNAGSGTSGTSGGSSSASGDGTAKGGSGASHSAPPSDKVLKEASTRYPRSACPGVVECFQAAGVEGDIAGEISFAVDAHGKVVKVAQKIDKGASDDVRACLEGLGRRKRILRFLGPPGRLVCTFSGSVTKHTRSVKSKGRYVFAAER